MLLSHGPGGHTDIGNLTRRRLRKPHWPTRHRSRGHGLDQDGASPAFSASPLIDGSSCCGFPAFPLLLMTQHVGGASIYQLALN